MDQQTDLSFLQGAVDQYLVQQKLRQLFQHLGGGDIFPLLADDNGKILFWFALNFRHRHQYSNLLREGMVKPLSISIPQYKAMATAKKARDYCEYETLLHGFDIDNTLVCLAPLPIGKGRI